jgi:hypothetical protein
MVDRDHGPEQQALSSSDWPRRAAWLSAQRRIAGKRSPRLARQGALLREFFAKAGDSTVSGQVFALGRQTTSRNAVQNIGQELLPSQEAACAPRSRVRHTSGGVLREKALTKHKSYQVRRT